MVVVQWYLLTPDGSRIRAIDRISIFICKLLIQSQFLLKDSQDEEDTFLPLAISLRDIPSCNYVWICQTTVAFRFELTGFDPWFHKSPPEQLWD